MDDKRLKKLKASALKILENGLIEGEFPVLSICELVNKLPVCRKTFYDVGLNKDDDIVDLLNANKVKKKAELRQNWGSDDAAPILQIALYKLIGTKEEREILNNKSTDEQKKIEISWAPIQE